MGPQPSGGFQWTQEPWGAALRCAGLAHAAPHVFTVGNLELGNDSEQWRVVAAGVGVEPDRLRLISQVHGVDLAIVRAGTSGAWHPPQADVIISDDPDVAIGVRVADCAPVLVADRRLGVVGAAHAGWRGTAKALAAVAVSALRQTFGSDPRDLVAAIGPCLGRCCGEVGLEVVEAFRQQGHAATDLDRWFTRGSSTRPHLDLAAANRDQLVGAGIPPSQIHVAGICTKTHESLFHSYRAHGMRAGRMVGLIRRMP